MPAPRVPTNILKLRGADKKNPARIKLRENESENTNPFTERQAGMDAEPVEQKKENAGRFRANTWLLNRETNLTNDFDQPER